METDLWRWDAVELAAAIRTRRISSREATRAVLERLAAVNPALNAVTVLLADQALAAADRADAAVRRGGALGLLHGVPVTIKENVGQQGAATAHGVAGIRPTLGRVPAYNQTAADERPPGTQLMSVQGPLARRVRDVRLGLAAMSARDPRDPWWAPAPLAGEPVARPIRVALTLDPAKQGVHANVAAAVRDAATALANAGYAVEEVEPPDVAGVAATWTTLCINEMRHVTQPYTRKYGGAAINRSLDLTLAAVPDVGLDGYMKALALRAKHIRDWTLFMERYPLVVGPVSTEPPFEIGFDTTSAEPHAEVTRAQRLLVAVNLLGFPAVSVPTGVAGGLPLGVQVIGARYREDLCLDAAEAIEAQRPLPTPIEPV